MNLQTNDPVDIISECCFVVGDLGDVGVAEATKNRRVSATSGDGRVSEDTPQQSDAKDGQRMVHVGVATMVVACAVSLFVGYRVGGPEINEVGFPLSPKATLQDDGAQLVTINTSDNVLWIPFSFELGQQVPDGPAADVLIRRHYWQAPGGAASLGVQPLMETEAPKDIEWVEDGLTDGFSANPVLLRWYSYSYWTHLLQSKHEVYAIRLRGDETRAALVRIESY